MSEAKRIVWLEPCVHGCHWFITWSDGTTETREAWSIEGAMLFGDEEIARWWAAHKFADLSVRH